MADKNSLILKKAGKKEVGDIFELEEACFPTPWSYNMIYTDVCENKITEYVLCKKDDTPAGYGGMWIILDEAHITNVCAHPRFRREGVASAVLRWLMRRALEKGADRITLEVRVSNVAAMHLYEKFGFHVCGKRTSYYSDNGEDAYILWCDDLEAYI